MMFLAHLPMRKFDWGLYPDVSHLATFFVPLRGSIVPCGDDS